MAPLIRDRHRLERSTQVAFTRLAHIQAPISGKPEIGVCSAPQRNQVYADFVNLSALLRCARDTPPQRCFAANSVPGRRAARCDLLALGHGEQAFALRQLPGGFARAPDRFRLLAGLALRRFFIRLAALHLTKDALALQLLFEHLEGLIDVVVAYEYLQNVSDLLSSAARAVKLLMVARSARFEILRRLLAAVADHLVVDHLTLVERGQAGALDRGDVDEYVFAAVLRRNEPITFRRVEPFHRASSHS